MTKIRLAAALFTLHLGFSAAAIDCPIGWAAVNALGQNGTTGGGNGAVVHVSTKSALVSYAGAATPYTIIVDSTSDSSWTNTATVTVKSHKTIIGANAGVVFDGFGLDINTQTNIILRNLTIRNANPDAIAIRASDHLWIDHCDLSACADGLLDVTIGSDYATVSWTRFHNHDKVTLVNSGTQHFEDVGKCRVTYHHNWFYDAVQRNPRIGYGKGHVFNNYYTNITSYCVGYHTHASVLVESNYFLNSNNPLQQSYTSNPWEAAYADALSVGNTFNACSGTTSGTGVSFEPEYYYNYTFALDTATNALVLVKASAGPATTNATVICPTPGNGAIDVYAQTNDLKWTDVEGVTSWDVYFGTTTSPSFQTNQPTRTFSPGTLAADTDYYWRVDAHTSGGVVTGDLWRFRTALTNASKPFPEDGELHAPLRVPNTYTTCKPLELTWTPGIGVVSNKVYLGTNATLTEADYRGTVASAVYTPGPLKYGTTYYWRIDTVKSGGSVVAGETWHFTSDITYSTAGRTEAENMVRSSGTYYLENDTGWFAASQGYTMRLEDGPGTLSSVWAGTNSICNVKIVYFDENDGIGWNGFYVNQTKLAEWFASANDDKLKTNVIANVTINAGDELRIEAYSNSGELNRTDCMDVEVLAGGPTPPSAPTGLVATPGDAQIWLSWGAPSGATGYIVKRSNTNGGPYTSIVSNTAPSYADIGLTNGTTYYYVVSAMNNAGQSADSSQVSATPVGITNSVLLAYDGFNYTAGTCIAGQAGGQGWSAAWQTFNAGAYIATNTAAGLTYGTLVTTNGALQVGYPQPGVPSGNLTADPQRVLPTTLGTIASTNSGVLWISFLMYNPMYPTRPAMYYRQSNLGLFSGASGTGTGGSEVAAVGLYNTSAAYTTNFAAWHYPDAPTMSSVPAFSTNVQLAVIKLVLDDTTAADHLYAWFNLNPALLGNNTNTPNVLTADLVFNGVDLSSANALRYQAGNYNNNGTNAFYTADELRLGTSFASVTPATAPGDTPPVLAEISDRTINVGVNLSITNNATDADLPAQALTYSLITTVTNATINASNGVFNWRPLVTQANTTNQFQIVVADNGSPSLSAAQSFSVFVNPLTEPSISSASLVAGGFDLLVNGQVGPDYAVQVSSNLVKWNTLVITNPATMPFSWSDTNTAARARFYRIKTGPPLP